MDVKVEQGGHQSQSGNDSDHEKAGRNCLGEGEDDKVGCVCVCLCVCLCLCVCVSVCVCVCVWGFLVFFSFFGI